MTLWLIKSDLPIIFLFNKNNENNTSVLIICLKFPQQEVHNNSSGDTDPDIVDKDFTSNAVDGGVQFNIKRKYYGFLFGV